MSLMVLFFTRTDKEGGSKMNRRILMTLMVLLLGAVMFAGCGEKSEKAAQQVSEKAESATQAAKETMESAADWTKDKMDTYLGDIKEKFGTLGQQVEDIGAKAESLGDDAKARFNEEYSQLTEKKAAISDKMEELQHESGDAWLKTKAELDKLMAEFAQLCEKIKKDFNIS